MFEYLVSIDKRDRQVRPELADTLDGPVVLLVESESASLCQEGVPLFPQTALLVDPPYVSSQHDLAILSDHPRQSIGSHLFYNSTVYNKI